MNQKQSLIVVLIFLLIITMTILVSISSPTRKLDTRSNQRLENALSIYGDVEYCIGTVNQDKHIFYLDCKIETNVNHYEEKQMEYTITELMKQDVFSYRFSIRMFTLSNYDLEANLHFFTHNKEVKNVTIHSKSSSHSGGNGNKH